MTQPQPELFELYRAGLNSAADLMKASLDTAERLQNQQLAVMRSALEEQTRLVNEHFERLMGYWAGLRLPRADEPQAKHQARKSA